MTETLTVEIAEQRYQAAVTRAAKLAAKGARGVDEAARQFRLAREARRIAAKTGAPAAAVTPNGRDGQLAPGSFDSFAAAVKEGTGATVVGGAGARVRALSAAEMFEQAAFDAALAGVDVHAAALKADRRAHEHRAHEQAAEEVRALLGRHLHIGRPTLDLVTGELARMMRARELGVRR